MSVRIPSRFRYTGESLVGRKFSRLKVVRFCGWKVFPCGQVHPEWTCKCDCGNIVNVLGNTLKQHKHKSCGCLQADTRPFNNRKHGRSGEPIYNVHQIMMARCYRKDNSYHYKNYGGRGIKVERRWHDFKKFDADMGPTWRPGLTLERIDNNKGYSRKNCKWATRTEQANNRRTSKRYTVGGVTQSLQKWAVSLGVSYSCLMARIKKGWEVERALTTGPL